MRRLLLGVAIMALCSAALAAEQNSAFLTPFRNARFVYVTSYDGPEFSTNLQPEDRQAIGTVQDALQKQGYTIVYRPQQADMIIAVESRPSEDVLAVYDRPSWHAGTYLWRVTGKGGLTAPNAPLVQQLEASLAKVGGKRVG
jgi:hypothetical protein